MAVKQKRLGMEAHKVVFSILKEIEKGKDIRSTPNSGRKGAFKRGWLDAASKGEEYKGKK